MVTYNAEFSPDDLVRLRAGIGYAIEAQIDLIGQAISVEDAEESHTLMREFTVLYVRIRRLNGFGDTAALRVEQWEKRAQLCLEGIRKRWQ